MKDECQVRLRKQGSNLKCIGISIMDVICNYRLNCWNDRSRSQNKVDWEVNMMALNWDCGGSINSEKSGNEKEELGYYLDGDWSVEEIKVSLSPSLPSAFHFSKRERLRSVVQSLALKKKDERWGRCRVSHSVVFYTIIEDSTKCKSS